MLKISTHLTYQDCNNYLYCMKCQDMLALREGKYKSCQGHLSYKSAYFSVSLKLRQTCHCKSRLLCSPQGVDTSCRQCCSNTPISHFHHSCFIKRSGTYLKRNGIVYGRIFIIISHLTTYGITSAVLLH